MAVNHCARHFLTPYARAHTHKKPEAKSKSCRGAEGTGFLRAAARRVRCRWNGIRWTGASARARVCAYVRAISHWVQHLSVYMHMYERVREQVITRPFGGGLFFYLRACMYVRTFIRIHRLSVWSYVLYTRSLGSAHDGSPPIGKKTKSLSIYITLSIIRHKYTYENAYMCTYVSCIIIIICTHLWSIPDRRRHLELGHRYPFTINTYIHIYMHVYARKKYSTILCVISVQRVGHANYRIPKVVYSREFVRGRWIHVSTHRTYINIP